MSKIRDIYALTPLQEGMYFHNELDSQDSSYHLQAFFRTNLRVNETYLRTSLKCVTEKYEVLKTAFAASKATSVVKQIVLEDRAIELKTEQIGQEYNEVAVSEYSTKDLERGFDLKNDSLMRVAVLSFSDVDVMCVSSHHIIVDGWSNPIIYRDVVRYYNLCLLGKDEKEIMNIALDEKRHTLSFGEYVNWIQNTDKEELTKYWEDYLDGYESDTDLSPIEQVKEKTDKPVNESKLTLSVDITNKLTEVAKKCETTISTVAQLAVGILLQKHCNTDDILVGNVVSGRNVPLKNIEEAVGLYINTIPLRIRTENSETIEEALRKLQETNSASSNFDHAALSGMKIYGTNISEYIKHLFVFENYFVSNEGNDNSDTKEQLQLEVVYSREQTNYAMNFMAYMDDGKLKFQLMYDPNVYSENNIDIVMAHLKSVVEQIADEPGKKLGAIELVSGEEREQILKTFNDTEAEYPKDKTVAELFEEQVKKTPDNIALVFEDEELTYRELNERANQIAHKLRDEYGVKADDLVAICAERSLEMIVGIFGIIKAGGAYVPIDPEYPEDRIRFMLEDSAPKAVLTYKADIKTEIPVIDLADESIWEGDKSNPEKNNGPENLIYCIYTSGTTGKPKGVLIEHYGVYNLAQSFIYEHDTEHKVDQNDKVLLFANIVFDATVAEIVTGLLSGAQLHVVSSELRGDTIRLSQYIKTRGITIAILPPAFLAQLDVEGLRLVITAGSETSKTIIESSSNVPIYSNDYGPTECTVGATFWKYNQGDYLPDRIPIGKPIYNKKIYIANGNTLCGIGMPGELCIAGDGLARGYLNRPELTAEKFVKNPYGEGRMYRTGDLARWLPDGNIEYLGRIDEQVKIRGFRIELGEIESKIREIEGIKDCAVIARADSTGDKAIYAYVVSEKEADMAGIREELGRSLPEYMIPSYMMQIDKIPVTRNGKLDKRALPDIEVRTGNEYIAPRNETERKICEIFSEILNVEQVSIKDSFFELGGHSLRATRLVNRIEAETGSRIALRKVFSNPTPEKLAELISGVKAEEYVPIPKAEEKEYYPMSSAQKRTYLICQMDLGGILYNMPQNMRLTGKVDPEALKKAVQELIDRHEILRTQFLMVDGEPVQKILEKVEADFEYIKDTETDEKELIAGFVRPFDLSKVPLVRVRLVDRGAYHLLSIDMHHIVGDGMSVGTFTRELSALYNGEELEPLIHQFKDYSEWMRSRDLSGQAEYWKNQFEDEIPVLDMPLDYPRPQEQSYQGAMTTTSTGKELGEKIRSLTAKTGTTEFMVFLSAAMVMLSKYSRQEDIVIGTPISGRTHKDTEGMLGMFVNTLAMRGRPEGKKTYEEFLKEIKETCLKGYENQEYPFEELVEAVDVQRDMSRNPLFDVMLVLQNNESENLRLGGANAQWAAMEDTVAKFDLTFNIYAQNEEY